MAGRRLPEQCRQRTRCGKEAPAGRELAPRAGRSPVRPFGPGPHHLRCPADPVHPTSASPSPRELSPPPHEAPNRGACSSARGGSSASRAQGDLGPHGLTTPRVSTRRGSGHASPASLSRAGWVPSAASGASTAGGKFWYLPHTQDSGTGDVRAGWAARGAGGSGRSAHGATRIPAVPQKGTGLFREGVCLLPSKSGGWPRADGALSIVLLTELKCPRFKPGVCEPIIL